MSQLIIPHLWCDKNGGEVAALYVDAIPGSSIKRTYAMAGTPSGDLDVFILDLAGQEFVASAIGPEFQFNPSVSFLIACESVEEVDAIWSKLSEGGQALMPLGEYPFSPRYGWTQDRFGLSWQVMLTDQPIAQKITPTMMYVGDVCGKAEEAINFYTTVFDTSRVGDSMRYGADEAPEAEGTIKHVGFELAGQQFAAMDSAQAHDFAFNEAVSLMIYCDTQEQIDYYWGELSAVPAAEQCGWLKDKYGLVWQVVPAKLDDMLADADPESAKRITEAFLKMKKFDLAELERAAQG